MTPDQAGPDVEPTETPGRLDGATVVTAGSESPGVG